MINNKTESRYSTNVIKVVVFGLFTCTVLSFFMTDIPITTAENDLLALKGKSNPGLSLADLTMANQEPSPKCAVKLIEIDSKDPNYVRYAAVKCESGASVTISEWTTSFLDDSSLRQSFYCILKECPYEAYFFESKGASIESAKKTHFEFILMNAPDLRQRTDRTGPMFESFKDQFSGCAELSCAFWSLGGDARLIAPQPKSDRNINNYMHLASFMRTVNSEQIDHIWTLLTKEYIKRQTTNEGKPIWFSTSGAGVSWLHIRVDDRPKYYSFKEFAETS